MLATQKACSALSKTAMTQCLSRQLFMKTSTVGGSKDGGSGGGGDEPKKLDPHQKPVLDETLDQKFPIPGQRDEAHDVPWRDGISAITHLYDMEEAKSLQQ